MRVPTLALLASLMTPALFAPAEARQAEHRIRPGSPLPPLALQDAPGTPVTLSAKDGKAYVLVFVRRDQPYSRRAVNDIARLTEELASDQLSAHLVWVARAAAPEPVAGAAKPSAGLSLPGMPWFDPERKTTHGFGFIAYPSTVLVDRDHQIIDIIASRPPDYADRVRSGVRLALGQIDRKQYERERADKGSSGTKDANSNRARLLASFATKLHHKGELAKAKVQFEKAMSIAPEDLQVVQPYAEFLLFTEKVEEARDLIDKLLKKEPMHIGLRATRARIHTLLGEYDQAAAILDAIRDLHPNKAKILLELGRIREHQEKWREAAQLYRQALELLLQKNGEA